MRRICRSFTIWYQLPQESVRHLAPSDYHTGIDERRPIHVRRAARAVADNQKREKTKTVKIPLSEYRSMLAKYLKPQTGSVVVLSVFLFSNIGLRLINPQILRYFIDAAKSGGVSANLIGAAFLFMGIALVQQVLSIFAAYFSEKVSWTASNKLRFDLMEHCLYLDMSYHNKHTPGEMIERVDGDVIAMGSFFSQFILQILGNVLLLLGILILLFLEDWRIGVGLTAFTIITFAALNACRNLAIPAWKALREKTAELYGYLEERMSGSEDIRSCDAIPFMLRGFYQLTRDRLKRQIRAALATNVIVNASFILFAVGNALALGLSAYLKQQNMITIGTVYLIFHYANMVNGPIQRITFQMETFQRAGAGITRIHEITHTESKIQDGMTMAPAERPVSVDFDGVSFSYGGEQSDEETVLEDLSFRLEPGRVLGLLGRTGSGKTTLIRLLYRLYDPTSGVVRLQDRDLKTLTLSSLRRSIGMVTQSVQVFEATLRDNLTLFSPDVDDQRVVEVIESIGLGDWYNTLDGGLDTTVKAGGLGLSAGQAQLLAFARIFLLKDPGLVILDEASSRLDPATEALLERAVDTLVRDRTAIIIAHRLSTVMRADEILILDGGRVRERGDRAKLQRNPASRFHKLLQTGLEEVMV